MAIITVDQLLDKVLGKVQDSRFDADDVITSFNSCCSYLSSMLDIRQLATVSSVVMIGETNSIALPEDYQKKLLKAYNTTAGGGELHVFDSRVLIDRKMSGLDQPGSIIAVAPDGANLYCQRVPPSDQTIRLYYFAKPADIEEGGEFPLWIPFHFIYKLFYHYAVPDLYDNLEDGINGEKVNTIFHEAKFKEVFDEFKLYIGPYPDHPYVITSDNVDFNFNEL